MERRVAIHGSLARIDQVFRFDVLEQAPLRTGAHRGEQALVSA
jgi:hypothetical protein